MSSRSWYNPSMADYTTKLHQVLDGWVIAHETNWTSFFTSAKVPPQRATDIKRGAKPQADNLRKLAVITESSGQPILTFEDLWAAVGQLVEDDFGPDRTGSTAEGGARTLKESGVAYDSESVRVYDSDARLLEDMTEEERQTVRDFAAFVRSRKEK